MSVRCPVCKNPIEECICCPECGHACPRDWGETYCPVCLAETKPKKQLEYVDSLGSPYAIIVGKQELERGVVKLRDMARRKEKELSLQEAVRTIHEDLKDREDS